VATLTETISLNLPTLPIKFGEKVHDGLSVGRSDRDWNRAILINKKTMEYLSEDETGMHWKAIEGPVYIGQLCAMYLPGSHRPLLHIELDPMPPEDAPGMQYIRGPNEGFFPSSKAALESLTKFARMMAFQGVWR
tara:strand:- start:76 stop:480 length:405 start_codon:yes stop_codon:yes gene_type:complete